MEIKFKRDTAFCKQFFVPDSFAHPAKMDAQLLIWIVERYTQTGETILDPMAGMGTMMLGCTLGRDVVMVELEEKFCKMMRDNWELVKMRPQLGSQMGNCQIIQGDARDLEGLFDSAIFSPPFGESKELHDTDFMITTAGDQQQRTKEGKIQGHSFTKEARERVFQKRQGGLPEDANNIANLPYGQIDKIVTSPPYEVAVSASTGGERDMASARQREKRLRDKGYDPVKYQGGVGRNLEVDFQYSKESGNIGNLKSDSYLMAMLQVYSQCYQVLKPQGLMILVTKNFIRNKQIVRLDTDTIKLCEQAGFTYLERHYRKLPSQSFWRIIYHQKHPEVEQINYEDVLVFKRRPNESSY